jgi:hypothetical protein
MRLLRGKRSTIELSGQVMENGLFGPEFGLAFRADKAPLIFLVAHLGPNHLIEECGFYVLFADTAFHGLVRESPD